MEINALQLHPQDNVVVCICQVPKGGRVVYQNGGSLRVISAGEDIPAFNKIAVCTIPADADVLKYGERIGKAVETIEAGRLVSHSNIVSVPRDYDSEMIEI